MALIKCPECNKEISDTSKTCVHCGFKIKQTKHFYQSKFAKKARPFIIAFLILYTPFWVISKIVTKQNFDETMEYYYHTVPSYSCHQYAQSSGISYEYLYECNIKSGNYKETACFLCRKEGVLGFNKVHGCVLKSQTSCNEYISN